MKDNFIRGKEEHLPIFYAKKRQKKKEFSDLLDWLETRRTLIAEKMAVVESDTDYDTLKILKKALTKQENKAREEYERECRKWNRLIRIAKNQKVKGYDIDIEQVRSIPIDEIIETRGIKNGQRVRYSCPLHTDKTPSFVAYLDQNSWWCYSCSEGGSVIDLYMKLNDCDVGTAIRSLHKLIN